jgi:hypothetical protein
MEGSETEQTVQRHPESPQLGHQLAIQEAQIRRSPQIIMMALKT